MTETAAPALAPETLFRNDDIHLVRSAEGYSMLFGRALAFKSWPDPGAPQTSALLFLRDGLLILRGANGQVHMPEEQLSSDERQLLAKIFTLTLEKKDQEDAPTNS